MAETATGPNCAQFKNTDVTSWRIRDGGGGGGDFLAARIFYRRHLSCRNIFSRLQAPFSGLLAVEEFFSLNFSLHEYISH